MLRLNELQRKKNGGTVFHEVDIDVIQGSRNVQNLAHEHLAQVEMLKQRISDTRRVRVSLGDDKTTTNSSSASTRSNKVSHITVQGKAPGESFLLDREGDEMVLACAARKEEDDEDCRLLRCLSHHRYQRL